MSSATCITLIHVHDIVTYVCKVDPWLYLGEVKWIEGALLSLLKGHHLDVQGPRWLNKNRIQKIFHIHGIIQVFTLQYMYHLKVCQFHDSAVKQS